MKNTALITGAAGGIGKSLCDVFSKEGYEVIATDITDLDDINCAEYIQQDLVDICNSSAALEKFTENIKSLTNNCGLNVLINNAAVQILEKTENIKRSSWKTTLDVNVTAPLLLSQSLLNELSSAKGTVINIGSVHSQLTKPEFISYATSKSALIGLTKALAIDLGNRIRVNAINPAATETSMLIESFLGNDKLYEELKRFHPLERIASPMDIANAALFLSSDKANFITGTVLNVDGGILSRLHDPA